jgi:hypothetical protein
MPPQQQSMHGQHAPDAIAQVLGRQGGTRDGFDVLAQPEGGLAVLADELPQGRQTPREAVPPITRVLLGADSDNTASSSTGWVADLRWAVAKAPP